MARRLLRTIVVSVTYTEVWTLVWLAPEQDEPPGTVQARPRTRTYSTRIHSTHTFSTSSHSTHTDATPTALLGGNAAASRTSEGSG